MKRPLILLFLACLAAAGGAWWWWSARGAGPPAWQGYAEADFVRVAPTQQGMLTAIHVARGDRVAAGARLFDQDDTSDRAARDQAAHQLDEAARQLANLQAPARPTEIEQAEANLADARANQERLEVDLQRTENLARSGNASLQSRDQFRADHASAVARVRGLDAALAQMRQPTGREDQIRAQMATVEAARAAVAMADWRLAQRHVEAPADAIVADVLARPGETLAAGVPAVALLPPGNIFIRFFVPQAMLSQVHRGDRVALACDNCPAGLLGTVDFIAPQAEYTPPLIYSNESRSKLVFLMQARPAPDQATLFNPGQPVTVRPLAPAAAP
ncbi:MAG TPA: HlyD family efflux transporter periplasmic adaptor subunit [Roseomonas sp.]|jgi:HlyD family secretion protein